VEIAVDLARNVLVLRVHPGEPSGAVQPAAATIDIGEGGRLLAVEVAAATGDTLAMPAAGEGSPFVSFDPTAATMTVELERQPGGLVRSAAARVGLVVDGGGTLLAVEVPRRGTGYEITYPSGNR
jgi:hypothetical protein